MGKSVMGSRASWLSVCAIGFTGCLVAAPQKKQAPQNDYVAEQHAAHAPNYYGAQYSPPVYHQDGYSQEPQQVQSTFSTRSKRSGTSARRSQTQAVAYHGNYYDPHTGAAVSPEGSMVYTSSYQQEQPQKGKKLSGLFRWPSRGHQHQAQPAEPGPRTSRFTGLEQVGTASWYGSDFHGRKTANGERYNMYSMTAAHRTLPFGTLVRVENVSTGQECVVRINNRGPYLKNRIIDLSKAAAGELGIVSRGLCKVRMTVLGTESN